MNGGFAHFSPKEKAFPVPEIDGVPKGVSKLQARPGHSV